MKRFSIIVLYTLLLQSISYGQPQTPILEPTDTTFDAIYAKLSAYFQNQSPEEEGGSANQFYRWAHFWRPRVDENGGFSGANRAISEFINNGMVFCDSEEDDHIDWRNLGPLNSSGAHMGYPHCSLPTGNSSPEVSQNQGRIDAISVHPNKDNEILAGGWNGGIWKTTDGGANWHNTTDDDGFSITGASVIVRHPQDPEIVYAATYSALGAWILVIVTDLVSLSLLMEEKLGQVLDIVPSMEEVEG